MRPYEAAVIFDASLEDTIIRETTEQVVEFVRSRGGTTGRVDRWGRRAFAYELRHRTEGYYVFIELSAEPPLVAELDRMLTLSDDVLRHRVIRQPETVVARPRPAPAPASTPPAAVVEVQTPAPEAQTSDDLSAPVDAAPELPADGEEPVDVS